MHPRVSVIQPDGADRYRVKLAVALAAITGSYDGLVILSDQVPYTSYRLIGEGQGHAGVREGDRRRSRCAPTGDTTVVDVKAVSPHRRRHRPARSAPDRQRVEDDAGPLLRVPAVESLTSRSLATDF